MDRCFDRCLRELRGVGERGPGTWQAEIEPPEGAEGWALRHRLLDATSGSRTINDGGGFFGVIAGDRVLEGQPVEVVFDPAALPPAGLPPHIELAEPNSSFAELVSLHAVSLGAAQPACVTRELGPKPSLKPRNSRGRTRPWFSCSIIEDRASHCLQSPPSPL